MKASRTARAVAVLVIALITLLSIAAVAMASRNQAVTAQAATATPAAEEAAVAGAFIAISPQAGFPLDPFLVSLQGGGPVDASTVSDACSGFVAEAPAVTVDYQGEADLLRAFFLSNGDTTLVVQTPDGDFLCNDDTHPLLLDPSIVITAPVQGVYSVWVGSVAAQDLIPGFLVFTTKESVTAGSLALADLVRRQPLLATQPLRQRQIDAGQRLAEALAAVEDAAALEAGGDDVTVEVTADGILPMPELLTNDALCSGLVSLTPSYAFDWSGETETLSLFVEAGGDTTLLVRTPDGSLLCSDDASADTLNPLVAIAQPAEGRYLVWVGRITPDEPVSGVLTITETADAQPAASQP
jgi:hypothetical protein